MTDFATIKQLSDEELAVKAQAGSHPCFEALVYRYSRRLYYFLRPKMSTPQDTEDLVQETFLKIYLNIGRFDNTYKFSTWLYTAASRLAISYFRKKRIDEAALESAGPAAAPHEGIIAGENYNNLWDAAKCLQKNQYQALWLRYMEEMPVKEIAVVMKKNRVHVRVLLHRARSHLAKMINSQTLPGEVEKMAVIDGEKRFQFL